MSTKTKKMKHLSSLAIIVLSSLMIISCGSSKFGELGAPRDTISEEKLGLDDSLGDVLKRHGGVIVREAGASATVIVRMNQSNSISLDTRPLYVVDGVMIGHDYDRANSLVIPTQIRSIKIKKSLSETAIYGEDGRNGVIEIRTKVNEDNTHSDKVKNGLE